MDKSILDDELWALIAPLLPPPKPRRSKYPGRIPRNDRAVLAGILFVLLSGIPWEMLPKELGCGSGMSCWRRLRAWQEAGVWDRLHTLLLAQLRLADRIDRSSRGGSANPDIGLGEISASMGDGNRLPRSRSNEKTSSRSHSRIQGQGGNRRPQR